MKDHMVSDLERMRHSAAHVMAAAVCRVFENVQLDIGPSTEDGFYYDFDLPHRLNTDDFARIEAEMVSKFAAGKAIKGYAYHSDHSVPPQVSWKTYQFIIDCIERHGNY